MAGTLSPRKLINYIRALPQDSTYARVRYGEFSLWDVHLHRLTDILEVLMIANWQRTGNRSGQPDPIRRPSPGATEVRSAPKNEQRPVRLVPGDVLPDGEVVLGPDDLNALFDKRQEA